ncbi:alkaline phosphatase D family protein [Phytoactinopolyspora limicola]|uniref:alkaline phosphatase D family protein n=1 Tax=Phytoactinopolyspora limicola TaxID=2715536 RepID=UPI00140B9852|nr:alkaline phosphatase D family protein [Phytoactinopolyspora limicola]
MAVLLAGVAAWAGAIPRSLSSDGMMGTIERPVQIGLLAIAVVGLLVSWRWVLWGGGLLIVAGAGLAALSLTLHSLPVSVLMLVVFVMPAAGLWLAAPCRRSNRHIVATVGGGALALMVGAGGIGITYHLMHGPTHPASEAAELPVDQVEWIWSGAVTPTSFRVTTRVDDPAAERATLVVLPDLDGDTPAGAAPPAPVAVAGPDAVPETGVLSWTVDGLDADAGYRYTVIVDDHADTARGQGTVRTFPDGPASFTVAVGACARTGSNGAVFDAIRDVDPLVFIHTGDFHYGNIDSDDVDMFRARYTDTLTTPAQSALYRSAPVAYVWDDHDYGANNADAAAPSRPAARAAYRENVPHYELPDDGAIYHAFTIGRVRFVLTDVRSERTAETLLGERQMEWFEHEMLTAADEHALVVWVNAVPWIGADGASADNWSGYPDERRQVAEVIEQVGVDTVVMLAGDAHMVAIDDGTNSGYGPTGVGFPVLHAAALDRGGSVKGGPYSHGVAPGGGQFGTMTIDDDGAGPITIELTGLDWTGTELMSYTFTVPAPDQTPP